MRCIFTNRTIGMTSFSIGTNPTIGTNGPSVWRIVSVCVYWTCVKAIWSPGRHIPTQKIPTGPPPPPGGTAYIVAIRVRLWCVAFKGNRLLMLPPFRWDFLPMVGSYGRRLYWQVSSCGTQTERINAKIQVLLHTCASYNIIQYLLNFGKTIYSHKKRSKSNSWKQCLHIKNCCVKVY